MARRSRSVLAPWLGVLLAGCGAPDSQRESAANSALGVTPASSPRSGVQYAPRSLASSFAMMKSQPGSRPERVEIVEVTGGGTPDDSRPKTNPDAASRKIVYTAEIALVVDDFAKLEGAIVKLVGEGGGYVADSDVSGSAGSNRSASWKVRIPTERFQSFLDSAAKLGELTRRRLDSQDVTEEYYDLDARIKNKKVEEARLLKHLENSAAKLEDILAAERELSRVREEVERQEGRLRLLANLAALTTVTITAEERTHYVPATAPGFATLAGRRFTDSIASLVRAARSLALWGIGLVPWLPLFAAIAFALFLAYRWIRRRIVTLVRHLRPTAP